MAQGLQCWDGAGNLVVDLGDYNIRYMGTYYVTTTPGGVPSYTIPVPGMSTIGWFVHYAPVEEGFNEWSAYCNNGSFTAVYLPTNFPPLGTYAFNVYKWTV